MLPMFQVSRRRLSVARAAVAEGLGWPTPCALAGPASAAIGVPSRDKNGIAVLELPCPGLGVAGYPLVLEHGTASLQPGAAELFTYGFTVSLLPRSSRP